MFLRKPKEDYIDRVEERFATVVGLIKDLDRKEFNRLQEGMQLAWDAYNKVRQAKSSVEKEVEEIDRVEQMLND